MLKSESVCLAETVDRQNMIIRTQSRIIDELFILLMQHISVEQAEVLPCIRMINEAALLRRSIGFDETQA